MSKEEIFIIAIEGIISAGKTTLIENLKEYFEENNYIIEVAKEPVNDWIKSGILEKFYSDPKRYGYHFQTTVFSSKVLELKRCFNKVLNIINIEENEAKKNTLNQLKNIYNRCFMLLGLALILFLPTVIILNIDNYNIILKIFLFLTFLSMLLEQLIILTLKYIFIDNKYISFNNSIILNPLYCLSFYNPKKKIIILERCILSDKLFMQNLYENGICDDLEYKNFNDWFDVWSDVVPKKPDLVIYLQTDITTCMERIKIRNRKEELNISESYQLDLLELHNNLYANNKVNDKKHNDIDVIILKDNEIDNKFMELLIKSYINN